VTDSPQHDQLPLPDFDDLPVESVESGIRTLDAEGVDSLVRYERAHGDRHPVLLVLERRLTALWAGAES
jgi:hypothetical protein